MHVDSLYPDYESAVKILTQLKIQQDFSSANNTIRYGHRKTADKDIYFIANRTDSFQDRKSTRLNSSH